PVPIPMALGDILLFSNMTFHGSKVNRSDGVRWSTDIRYIRTPGTYDASDEVLASEKYMVDLLAKKGFPAPMVVSGRGTRSSFKDWRNASGF
ncbi:MAG: phytanoyl-CoA dioxygenase family protein, partial [Pirellulales bacterium]|nr:phytanoyl-CoA dioxygenase family protein [Pirellulales bacterium]